jgi:hypothetical protein
MVLPATADAQTSPLEPCDRQFHHRADMVVMPDGVSLYTELFLASQFNRCDARSFAR